MGFLDSRAIYEQMVPERIRQQYSTLEKALVAIESDSNSIEAAQALFWMIYTLQKIKPSKPSRDKIERASTLEQNMRPWQEYHVKEPWARVFVYLHIAGCLALMLERSEPGYSARYVEILHKMEKVWDRDFEQSDVFNRSLDALIGNIAIRSFKVKDEEGKQEEALIDLVGGLPLLDESLFYEELEGVGQAAVDVFEKLFETNIKKQTIDWGKMAKWCQDISYSETLKNMMVTWKGETIQGIDFWPYAKGLCEGKLSLKEYINAKYSEREQEEKGDAERRLEYYFFSDCWRNIEKTTQEKLKNIDRAWFSSGKEDFGDIFTELQIATQNLIRDNLWDPFLKWRTPVLFKGLNDEKERKFNQKLNYLKEHPKWEPALLDFADMLELPSFEKYLETQETSLTHEQKSFLKKQSGVLKQLNPKRNEDVHGRHQFAPRENVKPLFEKFFGIDTPGILPCLARIAKAKSTASRDAK